MSDITNTTPIVTLTSYSPDPNTISPAAILDARSRLQNIISAFWTELDTRPNTVFGDIILTPESIITSMLEIAMRRFWSDMNLANVANGIMYNQSVIESFLSNFGVSANNAVLSSGSILIQFNANQKYIFDSSTTFSFNANIYSFLPGAGNPVIIDATNTTGAQWTLTQTGPNIWSIVLPVIGPAGAVVNDGDTATTTSTITQITSIVAAGNFNSGQQATSLQALALQAQQVYPAASLASRSGILSFLAQRWPTLAATSATVSGDIEMIRSGSNILGLIQGAADIFVRSAVIYATQTVSVNLIYNSLLQGWTGLLPTPVVPAFLSTTSGAFQAGNFNQPGNNNTIYSQSALPYVDNLGISYSQYEQLGLLIADAAPSNSNPGYISSVVTVAGNSQSLLVGGNYIGNIFSSTTERSVDLRIILITTMNGISVAQASVTDSLSGFNATVYFAPNGIFNPSSAGIVKSDLGYQNMFNGLDLTVMPLSGPFVLANMVGMEFQFSFGAQNASFEIEYLYDPLLVQVQNVVDDQNNRPVNVSLLARSFVICYIQEFTVNYTVPFGSQINLTAAQTNIYNYLNSLGYPNLYQESIVGQIMIAAGASGVTSVNKVGYFYPTLASIFIQQDGIQVPVPRVLTTTLAVPANSLGFGPRNVTFFVDQSTIQFSANSA